MQTKFWIPDFDSVKDLPRQVLPIGRYDVTILHSFPETSSKGNPMLKLELVVDNGNFVSHSFMEYFEINPTTNEVALKRLKNLCLAAGIRWEKYPSFVDFAAQFVPKEPASKYRVGIYVQHEYRKRPHTETMDFKPCTHEEYKATAPQLRSISNRIERFITTQQPSEMLPTAPDDPRYNQPPVYNDPEDLPF